MKNEAYEMLRNRCDDGSCRASCIVLALNALVEPLEHADQHGLAHIVELVAKEAKSLCHDVAEIPQLVKRENA